MHSAKQFLFGIMYNQRENPTINNDRFYPPDNFIIFNFVDLLVDRSLYDSGRSNQFYMSQKHIKH